MRIRERDEYLNWEGCRRLVTRMFNQAFFDIIKGGEAALEATCWLFTEQARDWLELIDMPSDVPVLVAGVRNALKGELRNAAVEITDEERAEIAEYLNYRLEAHYREVAL